MQRIILLVFLLSQGQIFSQQQTLDTITLLEARIAQIQGGEKLVLLDSLSNILRREPGSKFDSIVDQTIEYAIEIDSMTKAFDMANKHMLYLDLQLRKGDKASAFFEEFSQRKIDSSSLSDRAKESYAKLLITAGDVYYFYDRVEQSLPTYEKAGRWALTAGDTASYITTLSYRGTSFADKGRFAEAFKLYKECADVALIIKDSSRYYNAQNGIADLYSRLAFFDEAKAVRDKNIAYSKSLHDKDVEESHSSLLVELFNASIDADRQGKDSLGVEILEEALRHLDEPGVKNVQRPETIYALTRTHAKAGNLDKAKAYYNEMINVYGSQNPIPREAIYYEALTEYYMAIGDFKNALIAGEKSEEIFAASNYATPLWDSKRKLAIIYKELGDLKKSYQYFEEAMLLKDSVVGVQKTQALSYYQTLYETEKRDFKIADQASEISLLDAKNKINQQWLLFGGLGLMGIFSIVYLVRSRRFARSRQYMQEKFSQDLIKEQEKERTRLSRELHDSVGQKLMLLTKSTKSFGDSKVEDLAKDTLQEVRSISRGLHPANLETLGLTTAITTLINNIDDNTELFFTDEVENIDDHLSQEGELHLYRIIQESLSNIVKHAEAKAVEITVTKETSKILVNIHDNGRGFDINSKKGTLSLGLKTLYERAKILGAKIQLDSQINKGTTLALEIPLDQ